MAAKRRGEVGEKGSVDNNRCADENDDCPLSERGYLQRNTLIELAPHCVTVNNPSLLTIKYLKATY